ncbi:protein FAM83H [Anabas testudineus]|uniref:Scaffolding anchor of CK1 domain-containing protein n=1 Tax=Anabas testudineus TaxID=64144 RepID=A0A3Q1JTZ4_ANATE|nr:protein FAM83H [Anabas testudineus]
MARRSQCSSAGDNPLDPNYLPPHYREEYRLAIDALVEEDLEGYYQFLQKADVVDFLSTSEIQYILSSVQIPQHSFHPEYPEQHFLDTGGDGSSDTYWPIHSDLEVPGLDLGWPQLHHFIGPTEVTTLVNPPEPDMPSIKDQARRLIKNAQQVIAIVMDVFTDVDIFLDIINAAMRNVAVYILLDEQNAHHFVNMVSNCRVNLQSIQFLRVRTVSGITYHCRSGKSFKGRMMDRFLLTDCRAVLSGNYSFMWSFEKLHRCMAHLFLGQLVSTFDEEFRILFAQSQPLIIENVLPPTEEVNLSQTRQYPNERASLYRESRNFLSQDPGHPEEWARHSYDERMDADWRMKQESLHGPSDIYSRFPSQQPHMNPSFEQVPPRNPMMENPVFKRHSYAEGGHGRFSYPFLQQQEMPEPDNQRRQFLRGQQLYTGPGPGPEADYSTDKFWSQDYHSVDQYTEPQEMQPPHNFDNVLNYLSSTRNVDFDSSSDKLLPAADLSSSNPKRLSLGQPYACQKSPTQSNPMEKQFFHEPNIDRKDPRVKRGLRNWRITSYLSAYDSPEEEGLLSAPPQAPDPVEEPSYPIQQTVPAIDLSFPKIPNVREFKVHTVPRASQMPSYAKTTAREQPKKMPVEPPAVVTESRTTPTPSESSSTTEGEKSEEAEQKEPKEPKEPKTSVLRREDSFRRKYNPATPRSSRLRSSLIFSSLDQQHSQESKTAPGQQDEESDKNEGEQTKLSFVSQILGQRKPATREPNEWRRYMKSATSDNVATETSKLDDGNSKADDNPSNEEHLSKLSEKGDVQESLTLSDVQQTSSSPSVPQSKPSEVEVPKINQPVQPLTSLFSTPSYLDMNDPDNRLMFFKELAAKRKAAKAAEAEKTKDKSPVKPSTDLKESSSVKGKEPEPKGTSEKMAESKNVGAVKIEDKALLKPLVDLENSAPVKLEEPELKDASEKIAKPSSYEGLLDTNAEKDPVETVSTEAGDSVSIKTSSLFGNEHIPSQRCEEKETQNSIESKNSQSTTSLPASAEVESPPVKPPEEPVVSKPVVKESSPSHAPTPINSTAANVSSVVQGTDESVSPTPDSTSKDFTSFTPSSMDVSPSSTSAAVDSKTQSPESVLSESVISSTPLPSEQHTKPSVQGSSSDHILPDSGSQISPSQLVQVSRFASLITPAETISSDVTPEESSSTLTSVILPLNSDITKPQEPDSSSLQETNKSDEETSQKSTESEATQVHLEPVCRLKSSETKEVQPAHVESAVCNDAHAADAEAKTSSLESTTKTNSGESGALIPSEKDVIVSENSSLEMAVVEEPQVPRSSENVNADSIPPSLSPSLPEPCLPGVSDLGGSTSILDKNEVITSPSNQPDFPDVHSASEINIPNISVLSNPDMIPNASQSEATASLQDALTQATPPTELNLIGSDNPALADTVSCSSPLIESTVSVLSPEFENREINISAMQSPSDTNTLLKQITKDSDETPVLPSTETCSPPELTSRVSTEPDMPCETPESVTPESQTSVSPAENSNVDNQSEASKKTELSDPDEKNAEDTEATNKINTIITQEFINSEKANGQEKQNKCSEPAEITTEEVVSLSPKSKQPKPSQSRYHSSTANVLSSSNLRDDTKLLLEQISANSQSRNEASKEPPVTDDEKEDEADKNAKREKERRIKISGREQPKSTQEREKMLERIQSMRKERKVYSRFEL